MKSLRGSVQISKIVGGWLAEDPSSGIRVVQGSLCRAQEEMRSRLGAMQGIPPEDVGLRWDYLTFDQPTWDALHELGSKRAAVDAAQEDYALSARNVVAALRWTYDLSQRDIAHLLSLSHQRVQQLLADDPGLRVKCHNCGEKFPLAAGAELSGSGQIRQTPVEGECPYCGDRGWYGWGDFIAG